MNAAESADCSIPLRVSINTRTLDSGVLFDVGLRNVSLVIQVLECFSGKILCSRLQYFKPVGSWALKPLVQFN